MSLALIKKTVIINISKGWDSMQVKIGDIVHGKISGIQQYGIFVRLDSQIEGLIHISQISHKRIGNPSEVLKVGQYVNAKIMEIDAEKKKIELSMKELEEPELDIKANEEPAKEEKIEE